MHSSGELLAVFASPRKRLTNHGGGLRECCIRRPRLPQCIDIATKCSSRYESMMHAAAEINSRLVCMLCHNAQGSEVSHWQSKAAAAFASQWLKLNIMGYHSSSTEANAKPLHCMA